MWTTRERNEAKSHLSKWLVKMVILPKTTCQWAKIFILTGFKRKWDLNSFRTIPSCWQWKRRTAFHCKITYFFTQWRTWEKFGRNFSEGKYFTEIWCFRGLNKCQKSYLQSIFTDTKKPMRQEILTTLHESNVIFDVFQRSTTTRLHFQLRLWQMMLNFLLFLVKDLFLSFFCIIATG